jgi:A1 cistron-splicing factor AAR2
MATVLILNFPASALFGIDFCEWQVGPLFRGISNVPFGTHLVYSSMNERTPRTCRFITLEPSEDIVLTTLEWDTETEELIVKPNLESNEYLLRKYLCNLGPYPEPNATTWTMQHLPYLNHRVIKAIQPLNQSTIRGPSLFWTKIPRFVRSSEQISPRSLSSAHLDKSDLLDSMLSKYSNPLEIVSEFHAGFLLFFLGQNFSAFEQWKNMFILFSTSRRCAEEKIELFDIFCGCVSIQIGLMPDDFFVDPLMENNAIGIAISDLMEIYDCPKIDNVMKSKYGQGWRELVVNDEDLATIVDM